MTARLTDHLIDFSEDNAPTATALADNDDSPAPPMGGSALPIARPDRLAAAEIRRLTWRRGRNVRITAFRHRRQPVELRS